MRGLVAANRTIVAELLSSFELDTNEKADEFEQRSPVSRCNSLYRYVGPINLRRYALATITLAGVVAGSISVIGAFVVIALGAALLMLFVRRRESKRRAAIERDLPALLTSVASSVRAGIDPLRAIADAQDYFPPDSPFVSEISLFKQSLTAGDDEFQAIEGLLVEDSHPDVELFKRCIILSRRHGSSLADPLHRVVRVTRQRQSFKRKTRAALVMHRMSAVGIALCALLMAVMQVAMNPRGISAAFQSTAGIVLLSLGSTLVAAGVFWMLCMGREEKL
jgi:Flp pilus assembly protein TadB